MQLEFTGFYQGMISGSGNNDLIPAGEGDGLVNFETGQLGPWAGGGLNIHLEVRSGDGPRFREGPLLPTDTGAALALNETEQWAASAVYPTQRFGDPIEPFSAPLMICDPGDQTDDYSPKGLFENGMNASSAETAMFAGLRANVIF